ncbi:MAG: hypothetical protein ACI9NC_002706 [Verrucomicrobiales bacterium]|jgi:hypothetical protein
MTLHRRIIWKSKRRVVRLCFAAQGMSSWTRQWVSQMISRGL